MKLVVTGHAPLPNAQEFAHISNEKMLKSVSTTNMHLILRLSSLYELSRRKDPRVWKYIDELVYSGNLEHWLASIEALTLLGTKRAAQRLLDLYEMAENPLKSLIVEYLGRIIYPNQAHQFKSCVHHVIHDGIIDISGWNSHSISVLVDECSRMGIELSGNFHSNQSSRKTNTGCTTANLNLVLHNSRISNENI